MELPLFDTGDSDTLVQDSNFNALSKKSAFKKIAKTSMRDESFDELINNAGGLPNENEVLWFKSNGCSDTGSIYTHIAKHYDIEEMWLATWIISRNNIERLIKDIDSGKLAKLNFVVSERLKELKKADFAFLVEQASERDNVKIRVCNSHAKTFTVKTTCGKYFTVIGSGNWSENPRIESYCIMNDKDSFDFNKEWMEEVLYG